MRPKEILNLLHLMAIAICPCDLETLCAVVTEVQHLFKKKIQKKSQIDKERKTTPLDALWLPGAPRATLLKDLKEPGTSFFK